MRSRKLAAVFFTLLLAFTGLGTTAKATSLERTLNAIEQHHLTSTLDDLDESTKTQVICLALNLYHEARGSSIADIMAVGFSTRNRTNPEQEEKHYCNVIWQPGQYEWTKRPLAGLLPKEQEAWSRMIENARRIIVDDPPDTTNGATSFYSRKITPPAWGRRALARKIIGQHVFVKMPLLGGE